jgi:hypothetical protein
MRVVENFNINSLHNKNIEINGHILRYCSKCKEHKLSEFFHKNKTIKDGISWHCKDCTNERSKKIYINNIDVIRKTHRDYFHSVKGQFAKYKSDAKKRNIVFDIQLKEFGNLHTSPCIYCGFDEKNVGIDRVDNSKGYVKYNCVSCCSACNRSKLTLKFNEWIKYLIQISKFFYDKNSIIKLSRNRKSYRPLKSQYGTHNRHGLSREISTTLTFEEFSSFYEVPCKYCGTITEKFVCIDRVNCPVGYEFNNCVSCCKNCNSGKNDLSIEDWLKWIERIAKKYIVI